LPLLTWLNNIWALFIHLILNQEDRKETAQIMLDDILCKPMKKVWLGTAPNNGAERFYRMQGWTEVGKHGTDEIKFEMHYADWMRK
jgi:hypothetical protein